MSNNKSLWKFIVLVNYIHSHAEFISEVTNHQKIGELRCRLEDLKRVQSNVQNLIVEHKSEIVVFLDDTSSEESNKPAVYNLGPVQTYIHEISELYTALIKKADLLYHLPFPNSFNVNTNNAHLEKRCENLKPIKVDNMLNGEPIKLHKTANAPVKVRFTPALFINYKTIDNKKVIISETHKLIPNSHKLLSDSISNKPKNHPDNNFCNSVGMSQTKIDSTSNPKSDTALVPIKSPTDNLKDCSSLLDTETNNNLPKNEIKNKPDEDSDNPEDTSKCNLAIPSSVLLSTGLIRVMGQSGKVKECRVFLDIGSQSQFITENLGKALELHIHSIDTSIVAILDKKKHSENAELKMQNHFIKNPPAHQNTAPGLILNGSFGHLRNSRHRNISLNKIISHLFEVETVKTGSRLLSKGLKTSVFATPFQNTTGHSPDGRFVIKLLFWEKLGRSTVPYFKNPPQLRNSQEGVLQPLLFTEGRDHKLTEGFIIFLRKYLDLVHLKLNKGVDNPFDKVANCYRTFISDNVEVIPFDNLKVKKKPLTMPLIDMIIKEYGKFHAVSIAIKNQQPEKFQQLAEKCGDFWGKIYEYTDILTTHEESWKNLKPKVQPFLKKVSEGLEGMNVVVHGDCWINNLMHYHVDNQPLIFAILDWQTSKICLSDASGFKKRMQYLVKFCVEQDLV
ncbi:hypothetical protein Zmor_023708 [Zophobas morio]|uniref:CHK kinase-like domain-containing protein n=1 Tax=Zophobas morio TaxID=2755281 RepID=A0AA38M7C8_9CUCU|nr:hypothetical protein Zmor_023708 [Zophobas morio]